MRAGVFATGSSTRALAGAGYYGMMELSGNLWERPVSVGNAFGRGFTGVHGNGTLSANGSANETAWPGLSGGEVTDVTGVGYRGGEWSFGNGAVFLRVSDRNSASSFNAFKDSRSGGRGVRVSP